MQRFFVFGMRPSNPFSRLQAEYMRMKPTKYTKKSKQRIILCGSTINTHTHTHTHTYRPCKPHAEPFRAASTGVISYVRSSVYTILTTMHVLTIVLINGLEAQHSPKIINPQHNNIGKYLNVDIKIRIDSNDDILNILWVWWRYGIM